MKAYLLDPSADFNFSAPASPEEPALIQDLGLHAVFAAMAGGDETIRDVARRVLLSSLKTTDAILYRQAILQDCLENRGTVRAIYALVTEAITKEKKNYFGLSANYPSGILHRSVDVLGMFVEALAKLRGIADLHGGRFRSDGFRRFFSMIQHDLDDAYFKTLRQHLMQLKLRSGVLVSATLGAAGKGTGYVLREYQRGRWAWLADLLRRRHDTYTFYIAERDDSGLRALSELHDRAINLIANAAAQSNDHILAFLRMVRDELAFYLGCVNLAEILADKGEAVSFPVPAGSAERLLRFSGLYDLALRLNIDTSVVANDFDGTGKSLVMITGANQGGKSTFLRGIGIAQLMMQAGMFVPARAYSANLCSILLTHYKREEDNSMTSGKLDEELLRMSGLVDRLGPDSLVLFNESFQSTNEREGSAIARDLVLVLLEHRVKILFVTHLHDLARSLFERDDPEMAFLRAERRQDGTRSFHIVGGRPLPTSFGQDLYREIFAGSSGGERTATPHPVAGTLTG
ncbi:MAG: MutS-related protein [Acetobacteraceae bacterium]